MTPAPQHCRPEAFKAFAAELPRLETPRGLLRAASAIALHALPQTSLEAVEKQVDGLVAKVRGRTRSDHAEALVAHAHEVLFEEEGFTGNVERYYDPHNSYLPRVLETRTGLPITLSLIYHVIMHQLGVLTVGINAPMHFMIGLNCDDSRLYIDCFFGGSALSEAEALQRIASAAGRQMPADPAVMLPVATHRQWLLRILQNLMNVFAVSHQKDDAAAMVELAALLNNGHK